MIMMTANPDHVYAAKHLAFAVFKERAILDVEVDVRGRANEDSIPEQGSWINNYSDHALLYFEVGKV